MKLFLCSTLVLFASCSSFKPSTLLKKEIYELNQSPSLGKTYSGQDVYLGGFSGLSYVGEENGEMNFLTITDRGPNGYMIKEDRPFLIPDFSPQIVSFKTNKETKKIEVKHQLKLKKMNNQPLSGFPAVRSEENPVDVFGLMLSVDPMGLDTEGLVLGLENDYWIADEYAPSLSQFNSTGKMLRRLTPGNELPKSYLERKTNRGFEGIARIENKVFGILQSPLKIDQNFNRIVEVNLDTMRTSAEYFYELDKKSDRVGDIVALSKNQLLVIEQNGKANKDSYKKVYKITLGESDKLVKKELVFDLDQTEFIQHEKVEGLAFIAPNKIALINDNDFGITGETDFKSGNTPLKKVPIELMILEFDKI